MRNDKCQSGGQPEVRRSREGSRGPVGGGKVGGQKVIPEGFPEEVTSGLGVKNV